MAAKPPARSNGVSKSDIAISWLRTVVSDERFPLAVAAVKKRRRYRPSDLHDQSHQQLFADGYVSGFDDALKQLCEVAGLDTEEFHETLEVYPQVSTRNEAY